MNSFYTRTREGIEAFTATLKSGLQEPERLGYLALGELNAWSKLFGRAKLNRALSPLLPPLLAGAAVRAELAGVEKRTLLAGLGGRLVNDWGKVRTPDRASAAAVAGVVVHYGAYAWLLHRRGAKLTPLNGALRAAAWGGGVALAARQKPQLLPAVALGGAAAALTSALADDRGLQDGSTARQGIGHGANLAFLAEGLTLVRATLVTGDNTLGRIVDAKQEIAGVVGHALLVDALVRR